jgi:hypothetical protein
MMVGIISLGSNGTTRRTGWQRLLEPERVPDAVDDVADGTCRLAVVHSIAIGQWRRFDEETATTRPYMASLRAEKW